jgi:lysophospholipase L1-like esterase
MGISTTMIHTKRLKRICRASFAVMCAVQKGVACLNAEEKRVEPAQRDAGADWGALFKMHWQNRVRAFSEQTQAWQNVVLLGDSITEGFDVAKFFPGRRILNRGIGADVIGNALPPDDPRGVLQRLDCSIFNCSATDVFILIGINDLNSGRTVDVMEDGYRDLLSRLKAGAPRLKVHVQSLLPTRGDHDRQNEPVRQFNKQLKKLSEEYGYDFIDLHALMVDGQGQLKTEFTPDGLHLNDAAYGVWREQILKSMQWP